MYTALEEEEEGEEGNNASQREAFRFAVMGMAVKKRFRRPLPAARAGFAMPYLCEVHGRRTIVPDAKRRLRTGPMHLVPLGGAGAAAERRVPVLRYGS